MPSGQRCLAIVLAAGEGTRMRSARPKVLHAIAGRSMLAHVIEAVKAAGVDAIAAVIGPDHAPLAAEIGRIAPQAEVFTVGHGASPLRWGRDRTAAPPARSGRGTAWP